MLVTHSFLHPIRAMKPSKLTSFMCLLAALVLAGCDCCPMGGQDPLATEIIEIRVEPNPVAVGETTTFTIVIKDSTAGGFSYYWAVPGGAETTVPHYTWTVDTEPGEYRLSVRVSRTGFEAVGRPFTVTVVDSAATSLHH